MNKQMINYLRELFRYHELLIALTKREITVRYKQTLLGAAWAMIQPLAFMVIFAIVFGFFLKIESNGLPYPIFSYSALLPWTFFASSVSFGALSVVNNGNLISKVYFPRETMPFANLLTAFVDFIVACFIFVLMFAFYKIKISANIFFAVPIVAIEILFISSVLLFTSAMNVIWRDIKFIVPLALQLWMFATPVIYPASRVPQNLKFFYFLNPMSAIVENFRRVTVGSQAPDWRQLIIALFESLVLLWIGYAFFKVKEKIFADII